MILKSILTALLLPGSIVLFSSNDTFAQDTVSDTSFYQKALVNTMAVYHSAFVNQSALYNGPAYAEYPFRFNEGQPFFYAAQPVYGSVIYDGIKYDSVLMRYDEVADVLTITNNGDKLQLHSSKVQSFNLFNADFVRMERDSLRTNLINTGFYNLLYKGKVSLLKKQVKTIKEVISSNVELQHLVDEKDQYYVQKEEGIYLIKSKKDLFNLFEDRKKELQRFIKANDLNFRKDRQNTLTKATAYYDSLKK